MCLSLRQVKWHIQQLINLYMFRVGKRFLCYDVFYVCFESAKAFL